MLYSDPDFMMLEGSPAIKRDKRGRPQNRFHDSTQRSYKDLLTKKHQIRMNSSNIIDKVVKEYRKSTTGAREATVNKVFEIVGYCVLNPRLQLTIPRETPNHKAIMTAIIWLEANGFVEKYVGAGRGEGRGSSSKCIQATRKLLHYVPIIDHFSKD